MIDCLHPARDRLSGWLDRKLQGGGLRGLPRYSPLRGPGGQCAEAYAETLLAALGRGDNDLLTLEQLRDDGRAFRSWAECARLAVGAAR